MSTLPCRQNRLAAALLLWAAATTAGAFGRQPIAVEVRETAGIRRFQYPVAAEVLLPEAISPDSQFRLTREGQPALLQARPAESGDTALRWRLDFPVDLLPYETLIYRLEYGGDVPAGPQRKLGLSLTRSDDGFRIANEPHIAWNVPADLSRLLSSVRGGEMEYLSPDSSGLMILDRDGKEHRLGGANGPAPAVSVSREGPLAVGLRFAFSDIDPALAEVRSTVDLVFPVFKSWVEVDWRIEDPQDRLSGAKAMLHLNLDAPTRPSPTLVDFGAGTLVYLSLSPGRHAQLIGGSSPWQVLRGTTDRMEPFVTGARQVDDSPWPEGWAHVMDRRRCLALAADGFAANGEDRIDVSAEGAVGLYRHFRAGEQGEETRERRLHFWLHFIPFPPQQTAATSPQAMQNPILVHCGAAR